MIRDNPLGLLTTAISSPNFPLLQTSHIPFVLDIHDESSETELGSLRGHVARQNPQSKAMIEALSSREPDATGRNVLEQEVLVMFNSPTHHYVTPKFYTETKPATGKVAPTWNYAAVQVYGRATVYFDSKSEQTSAFLSKQVTDLTDHNEKKAMAYTAVDDSSKPWTVSEAPERYVELLKKAIIGVEIKIDRMEGKFKMSQESTNGDIDGIVRGFESISSQVGDDMASLVQHRRDMKKSKA